MKERTLPPGCRDCAECRCLFEPKMLGQEVCGPCATIEALNNKLDRIAEIAAEYDMMTILEICDE